MIAIQQRIAALIHRPPLIPFSSQRRLEIYGVFSVFRSCTREFHPYLTLVRDDSIAWLALAYQMVADGVDGRCRGRGRSRGRGRRLWPWERRNNDDRYTRRALIHRLKRFSAPRIPTRSVFVPRDRALAAPTRPTGDDSPMDLATRFYFL